MIELSLNEVEMLAAKTARGAGFSWGLCDDIGKCAKALAAGGLPWAPSLLALARDSPSLAAPTLSFPAEAVSAISAPTDGSCLCPIRTGALIADRPGMLTGHPLRIERVAHPLWLVGFAALWDVRVRVSWKGACADVAGGAIAAKAGDAGWLAPDAGVTISRGPDGVREPDGRRRASIDPTVFEALGAIAARTYVPASDNSRATGAGGSRTDDE
ncbi:DUF3726 domain-containing protein [Mesorhizobium sp. Mes31]|uniref:DUF3726 domain-containing protein n=1 Tax=Mesorhizobium sp. Mes31 TaxID=2926017 RepID=UPI00211953DC|nr:DUF3726 domain-containing protein [Mesorhizobium sp. Mes31]